MSNSSIICRPTPWFYWRATLLFIMLLGGGSYFIYDYHIGYPEKNVHYFTHKQFQEAQNLYAAKMNEGLTAREWAELGSKQNGTLAPDGYPLPEGHENRFPWPDELLDSELMASGFSETWRVFTGRMGWDESVAETPKDQRTVNEQLYFGTGALVLSILPLFFLIRTSRRTMKIEDGVLSSPAGISVPIKDIKQIDLRKWKTKGLARVEGETADGSKTLRLDGLTYGGFKKEHNEPAEVLMQTLLKEFDGEIIEYEEEIEEELEEATKDSSNTEAELDPKS